MRKRAKQILTAGAIALGAYLLIRAFRGIDPAELWAVVRGIPAHRLAIASALIVTSYFLLSLFDYSALRHFKIRLPYPAVLKTAFISYVANFNFGSAIGAVGLRYRLYDKLGLSTGDVARVTVFVATASIVGYGVVAGIVHTIGSFPVPERYDLPFATFRPVGLVALAAAGGYVLLCHFRTRPLQLRRWRYEVPDLHGAGFQIGIACAQWLLASAILFSLLPPGANVTFGELLAVHLIAAIVGVIAHVPAGYGVLEGTFLLMLGGRMAPAEILGSILVFRALYNLVPLAVAVPLLVSVERNGFGARARKVRSNGQSAKVAAQTG